MLKIEVTLRSDLCAGSGASHGLFVDADIVTDDHGLPLIPARRLKGCLRDSADFLAENGCTLPSSGKTLTADLVNELFGTAERQACLLVEDAQLPGYRALYTTAAGRREAVTALYTRIVGQTRLDNGVAAPESLRYTRVLNRWDPLRPGEPLRFFAAVTLPEERGDLREALALCCKATRRMGTHRSRGLGEVSLRLAETVDGAAQAPAPLRVDQCGDAVTIEYHLAFDGSVALNTDDEGATVPGRAVIGALAEIWLRNKAADEVFDRLFLTGETRWSDLTPVIHGRRSEPVPQMMVWLRGSGEYGNRYLLKPGEKEQKQKPITGRYGVLDDGRYLIADVPVKEIMHHRRQGRGMEAQLYQQRAISRGMIFGGRAACPAELAEQVLALLGTPGLRIGRSRSAQYGGCRLSAWKQVTDGEESFEAQAGERLYAILCSDLLLAGEDGLQHADDDSVRLALARALNVEPAPDETDYTAYRRLGGYQASWGLRKPQLFAAAAGSVYCLRAKGGKVPRTLTLGEYRQEGLGSVRILRESELPQTAEDVNADTDRPAEESRGQAETLASGLLVKEAEAAAEACADEVFHRMKKALTEPGFNGTLNRIRGEARGCETPGGLMAAIAGISQSDEKNRGRRETALKLLEALFGDGSAGQVAQTLLSGNRELRQRVMQDAAAMERFASGWKKPLMQVIHKAYFSKAEGGGRA